MIPHLVGPQGVTLFTTPTPTHIPPTHWAYNTIIDAINTGTLDDGIIENLQSIAKRYAYKAQKCGLPYDFIDSNSQKDKLLFVPQDYHHFTNNQPFVCAMPSSNEVYDIATRQHDASTHTYNETYGSIGCDADLLYYKNSYPDKKFDDYYPHIVELKTECEKWAATRCDALLHEPIAKTIDPWFDPYTHMMEIPLGLSEWITPVNIVTMGSRTLFAPNNECATPFGDAVFPTLPGKYSVPTYTVVFCTTTTASVRTAPQTPITIDGDDVCWLHIDEDDRLTIITTRIYL